MRLMRHPQYRLAHGTGQSVSTSAGLSLMDMRIDDHYAPLLFVAGAAGDDADTNTKNYAKAECWELIK